MSEENYPLDTLQDIRRMMRRSSKFLSLSGLSGLSAGAFALIGACIAFDRITAFENNYGNEHYSGEAFQQLKYNLLLLAIVVLLAALVSAFFFTWRRAHKNKMPLWDHTSKALTTNMLIPLVSGGLLILIMLHYNEWRFVGPLSLIFYGLALVNASKYTLDEIFYLGLLQLVLGLVNALYIGYSLYFWAFGFGVFHIIYGFVMWWKNERRPQQDF